MKDIKSIIKLILSIILIIAIGVGAYFFIKKAVYIYKVNTVPEEIAEVTKNGVYEYKEYITPQKVSSTCIVSNIKHIVSIINDEYTYYQSSCIGTYQKETGNIKDLEIKYDNKENKFYVLYKENKYELNEKANAIMPIRGVSNKITNINPSGYKYLINTTEIEGNYYDFTGPIVGLNTAEKFKMVYNKENEKLLIEIVAGEGESEVVSFYQVLSKGEYDILPDISVVNSSLAIIDYSKPADLELYNLRLISSGEVIYNLHEKFPITVNGVTMSPQKNNIFVKYSYKDKSYRVLVGFDNKYCVEKSESNSIIAYEFSIEQDYAKGILKDPKFIKAWTEKEGCSRYNELKGDK